MGTAGTPDELDAEARADLARSNFDIGNSIRYRSARLRKELKLVDGPSRGSTTLRRLRLTDIRHDTQAGEYGLRQSPVGCRCNTSSPEFAGPRQQAPVIPIRSLAGVNASSGSPQDLDNTARKNKEGLARVHLARPVKSAITYFPAEQYHRLQELNFCVRDGNRCDPLHMVTDKSEADLSVDAGLFRMVQMSRVRT